MLTKGDLNSIGKLIDGRLDKKLRPVKEDINGMKADISGMKEGLSRVGTIIDGKLKPIKRDLREVKKDVKDLIHIYDEESHHATKRLDRLEDHLELPRLPKPYEQSSAAS